MTAQRTDCAERSKGPTLKGVGCLCCGTSHESKTPDPFSLSRRGKEKMFVRFTTPLGLPCYGDWDFRVYPGVFELDLSAVLEHLRASRPRMLKHWPDYAHANKCIAELECLIPITAEAAVVTLDDYLTRGLWIAAGWLILDGEFRSVYCPECNTSFSPAEISRQEWQYGEDLAASGGDRFVCPANHTLYAIMRWNS